MTLLLLVRPSAAPPISASLGPVQGARRIDQGTIYTLVFQAVLATDHYAAATGKTLSILLSKAGAGFSNPNAGPTVAVEMSGGYYKFELDAIDTNTLGDLFIIASEATCDTSSILAQVVEPAADTGPTAAAIDAIQAKTDLLPSVAPGADGGLVKVGVNSGATSFTAGVTISNAAGTALTVTSSGADGNGITVTGNGDGHGIWVEGGASGGGMILYAHGPAEPGLAAWSDVATGFDIWAGNGIAINAYVDTGVVLGPNTEAALANAVLDQANGIETGVTPRGALRLNTSALAGKVSGGGTSTETFRNVGDTKNRIISSVDASGNRTSVTTDTS